MVEIVVKNGDEVSKKYQGIAGWLLLPLLGIVIIIMQGFYYFLIEYLPIFFSGDIYLILYPEVPYSDPSYLQRMIFFISCLIILIGFQLFSFFLLWKFLIKSKTTPKLYIIWIIGDIVGSIVILMMVCFFPAVGELYDLKEFMGLMKGLGQSIFSATIWIPYFIVSKRVENTFIM